MTTDRSTRQLALAHGITGLVSCLCLIVFYVAGGPFGVVNDVGNAALGVLSAALAWYVSPSRLRTVLTGVASLGAAITVVGTVLVATDATGFFLAGLVSSVGFAVIGSWLIVVSRLTADPSRLRRAGLVAGAVMVLGFVNAPGIAMGLDDLDTAPAWTYLGGFSWAGTYLLFPIWSLRKSGGKKA